MNPASLQLDEVFWHWLQPRIAAEVERQVAERLAVPVEPKPQPLGIDPEKLYTRQEACELLKTSDRSLRRAETRHDKKRLVRRGNNSRPKYLGADLLRLAKISPADQK